MLSTSLSFAKFIYQDKLWNVCVCVCVSSSYVKYLLILSFVILKSNYLLIFSFEKYWKLFDSKI